MISNHKTFFLGVFIFIIPFLGLPSSWKTILIVLSGTYLAVQSIKVSFLIKKTFKPIRKKEKVTPVFVENMPMQRFEPRVEVREDSAPIQEPQVGTPVVESIPVEASLATLSPKVQSTSRPKKIVGEDISSSPVKRPRKPRQKNTLPDDTNIHF